VKSNGKKQPNIPYEFIFEMFNPWKISVKPMFGCYGIYYAGKIVFLLRGREKDELLNGVWVACQSGTYFSLAKDLPSLDPQLKLMKNKKANGDWLLIPSIVDHFEADVRKACELIVRGDERIGKITKKSLYS
jgi:hypothetical protein